MLGNTPASVAASTLDAPRAIASQNRTRCSLRPAGGRPTPRVPAAAARSRARLLLGIATPQLERCDDRLNSPHHRRVISRPTMTIRPVHLIERGEVHLLDRRQHRPHKVIRRHPIQQRRRQQQRLLAVARDEVLRHAANFIKRAGRDFSRHPRGIAIVRRRGEGSCDADGTADCAAAQDCSGRRVGGTGVC